MAHLFVLLPLLSAIFLNLIFKKVGLKIALGLGVLLTAIQAALVFMPAPDWLNLQSLLGLHLRPRAVSLVMLLSIAIVTFSSLMCSGWFLKDKERKFYFVNLALLSMMAMNGIVLVRDIFSLYVFIEIAAVSSFILISFDKERDAFEGAFKYILFSVLASVLMLISIALLILVAKNTTFAAIREALAENGRTPILNIAVIVFIISLFIKSGVVPFHSWVPDAYSSAPHPVSVLLAGITTKACGVYALIRVVYSVFGFSASLNGIILAVGALSVVVGAVMALVQGDLKRMLSYSSISQIGYILLGLGCADSLGLFGAVFHLFNHAIFKSLLFLNSASIFSRTGTTDMRKMGGLSDNMPVTACSSVLGGLSMAGIPPLSGFWSKLIIIIALWNSGNHIYAIIAVLASLLTLAYVLSMQRMIFWGKDSEGMNKVTEAARELIIPVCLLSFIILAAGAAFPFVFNDVTIKLLSICGR